MSQHGLVTCVLHGDARAIPLPDASVHTIVTSPPYWGLRDYGFDGQIGSEPTPELYVQALVEVFREVRRVLRDDGTCWLNLGDSYASAGGPEPAQTKWQVDGASKTQNGGRSRRAPNGIKSKDLIGIPWMVAFALRADGWYLRAENIWAKGISFCPTYAGSSMPESVTDRPARSHETVFLLTKRSTYYYDHHAVKEATTGNAHSRGSGVNPKARGAAERDKGGNKQNASWSAQVTQPVAQRNLRSVWTINPRPYPGAHFATFPDTLVTPCIKAGTSEHGACADCGRPYKRMVEKGAARAEQQRASGGDANGGYEGQPTKDYAIGGAQDAAATKASILAGMVETRTIGWVVDCSCPTTEVVPCVVLDPFSGSGTTAATAHTLGRIGIGVEANPEYIDLANARLAAAGAL